MNPSIPTMESVSAALGLQKKMKLKYVMLDVSGIPTPIIFPAHLPHDAIKTDYEVISAGFCEIECDDRNEVFVQVSGGSLNLGLSSRPEDAEIIEKAIR